MTGIYVRLTFRVFRSLGERARLLNRMAIARLAAAPPARLHLRRPGGYLRVRRAGTGRARTLSDDARGRHGGGSTSGTAGGDSMVRNWPSARAQVPLLQADRTLRASMQT